MKVQILVLSLLYICLDVVQCARILGIFPLPAPSQYILGNALMKDLAAKGHDITIVSYFVKKNKPQNGSWTDIQLVGAKDKTAEDLKGFNVFDKAEQSVLLSLAVITKLGLSSTEAFLSNPNVQKLLNSNEKFDVVIIPQFLNDALKYIGNRFNAPVIAFSQVGQNVWVNYLVGNPDFPSIVGDLLLGLQNRMTLSERVKNTLVYVTVKFYTYFYYLPAQEAIFNKYFPDAKENFYDVVYNTSLVLLNGHSSSWEPAPLMPNMIEIGGFHIQPPKVLPKDLKQFLDSAKDGAIYFSMGSNLKSKDLSAKTRDAFINVFAKLKQKVLWKFEDTELPGMPENVKIMSWAPQQDVLAHANVKVFITHGGFGGYQETIYHGVPILAIPIAGDQELNAQRAVTYGIGLKMQLSSITEESLTQTLSELLNNPKYKTNAKKRSRLMHDKPRSAKDTATFWVEYVIRHQGSPHLRSAAMDLTWYQYIMLDVLAIIGGTIVVSCLFIYYFIRICCFGEKSSKVKKK